MSVTKTFLNSAVPAAVSTLGLKTPLLGSLSASVASTCRAYSASTKGKPTLYVSALVETKGGYNTKAFCKWAGDLSLNHDPDAQDFIRQLSQASDVNFLFVKDQDQSAAEQRESWVKEVSTKADDLASQLEILWQKAAKEDRRAATSSYLGSLRGEDGPESVRITDMTDGLKEDS